MRDFFRNAKMGNCGESCGRILAIVLARHKKFGHIFKIFCVINDLNRNVFEHRHHRLITWITNDGTVRLECKRTKCTHNVLEILVVVEMIRLNICNNQNLRTDIEKRTLIFTRFNDKLFPAPHDEV